MHLGDATELLRYCDGTIASDVGIATATAIEIVYYKDAARDDDELYAKFLQDQQFWIRFKVTRVAQVLLTAHRLNILHKTVRRCHKTRQVKNL